MQQIKNYLLFMRFSREFLKANSENGTYHKKAIKVCADSFSLINEVNDGSISEGDLKKIRWYMVSAVFLGKLLGLLFDEQPNPEKSELLFKMGGLMGVGDILTDKFNISGKRTFNFLYGNEPPELPIEKITKHFFTEVTENTSPEIQTKLTSVLKKGVEWQTSSEKQTAQQISQEEINAVTLKKGGVSVLLTSLLFDRYSGQYDDALFSLGGFIQYLNDAQDLHKDACDQITTFVNFRKNFEDIVDFLEYQKKTTFTKLLHVPWPSKSNQYYFLFSLHCMFTGIIYKVRQYQKLLGNRLEIDKIRDIDKKKLYVHPVSVNAMKFYLPQIGQFSIPKFSNAKNL